MAGLEPASFSEFVAPAPHAPCEPTEDRPALVRSIAALADDGYSAEEIGKALSIPRARAIRIARRQGIELARAHRRRLRIDLPAKHIERIAALAEVAKVTRAVMIARMVAAALEEDDQRVRRNLGKLGRPKRIYRARPKKG